MTDTDALFQFPCEFPIKVMGRDSVVPRSRSRSSTYAGRSRPIPSERMSHGVASSH
jgi:hypothetical protein